MKTFEEYLAEAISVETNGYVFAHGKKPRGRGNWMIGIGKENIDFKTHEEGVDYVYFNGDLKDAVKKATPIAKAQGVTRLYVLS